VKILFIEDDRSVQEPTTRLLIRRLQATVTIVEKFKEAERLLQAGDFDLVLCDGTIIGGHGTELFARYANTAGKPWVFQSAEVEEPCFNPARSHPLCRALLCKPVMEIKILTDAIERALQSA
jgi:CheY-like chemotaxis protein